MKRRRKMRNIAENIACHFVVGAKKVNTLFVCSRHSNSRFDYELKLMELCCGCLLARENINTRSIGNRINM